MNVLLAPAHYYVSDKYGSEPQWSYEIINYLSKKTKVTSIVGTMDVSKKIKKVKIIETLKRGRSKNPIIEIINKIKFTVDLYKIAKKEITKNDVVHHILPFSESTYNLLAISNTIKNKPFIIGPVQLPQTTNTGFAKSLGIEESMISKMIEKMFNLSKKPLKYLFIKTIKKCDALICSNKKAKEYFSRYINKNKIKVIEPGVNTQVFKPKKFKKKHIEILSTGYLIKRKGNDYLIKAMERVCKKYPNALLRIVGFGPEENNLKRLVKKLKLSNNIIFEGYVPHLKIIEYYQKCDMFCLPTLSDSAPTAVLEALSCGKPVIASDVGGIPEMITNEIGMLTKPKSVKNLSDGILKILESGNINKMGKKARKRVQKKYSWENKIDEYIKLYESLI